jgi:hypothetical protein
VPRADPLEPGEPLTKNPAAADQIGAAQRQFGMARAEIRDPAEDLIEIVEVALLQGTETEARDHPTLSSVVRPVLTAARSWPWPVRRNRTMAPG